MRLIRILGSIRWITDQDHDLVLDQDPPPDLAPDPALCVSGFQDANKKSAFYKVFFTYYLGTVCTFITVFKVLLLVNGIIRLNKYGSRSGSLRPKNGFSGSGPGYRTLQKTTHTKKYHRRSLL
jgi:hypothetical protein